MKPRWIGGLLLLALTLVTHDTPAGVGGAVRVYTNEDVERLAPLPAPPAPLVGFDRERWEFVIQFLEREFALLEAERDQGLDRAILVAEVEAARDDPRYGLRRAPDAVAADPLRRRTSRPGAPLGPVPVD